jgi:hypothetical protein
MPDVVPDVEDVLELDDVEEVLDVVDDVLLDEVSVVGATTGVTLVVSDNPEVALLSAVVMLLTLVDVAVVAVAVVVAAIVPEPSVIVGGAPMKFDGDEVTVPLVGEAAIAMVPPGGTVFVTPDDRLTLPPELVMLMLDPLMLAFWVMVPKELKDTGPVPPLTAPPRLIVLPVSAVGADSVTPLAAEIPPLPIDIGLRAVSAIFPEAWIGDVPLETPPVLSRLKLPLATLIAPSVNGAPCLTVRFPATDTWLISSLPFSTSTPAPVSWLNC